MEPYTIEDIELLRKKSGLSYKEAVNLQDYHSGSLARALIDLEKHGRLKEEDNNGKEGTRTMSDNTKRNETKEKALGLLQKLYRSRVKIRKGDTNVFNVSVLFSALCLLLAPHMTIAGVIVSMILGYQFSFTGMDPDFASDSLEKMVKSAAQNAKSSVSSVVNTISTETKELQKKAAVSRENAKQSVPEKKESAAPKNKHGMGVTLIRLIQKYGIVGYDAMRTVETPVPQWVFMLGAAYTPQEFARSVCAPNEYIALTSTDCKPYYKEVDIELPANWLHDRFYNIPMDTLLTKTEQAVREHHGVCWESKEHAMAIVGIAHDDSGEPFFIMKNSWGTEDPYKGLTYLSFEDFRDQTLAIEMPLAFFQTAMVR